MSRTITRKLKSELQNLNDEQKLITIEINISCNHTNSQLDSLLDMMDGNIMTLNNNYKKKEIKKKEEAKK